MYLRGGLGIYFIQYSGICDLGYDVQNRMSVVPPVQPSITEDMDVIEGKKGGQR